MGLTVTGIPHRPGGVAAAMRSYEEAHGGDAALGIETMIARPVGQRTGLRQVGEID
jgi:hypothetical protein